MEKQGYYYLKLKENFFDSDEMKLLESFDNGYLYSNILLKLYLKSLKNNGKLVLNDYIPYNAKMIATLTGHNVDIVEKALEIFANLHLIEVLDNGAIYMLNIQNLVGSISSEGIRKQEYRMKIAEEKESGTKLGQCPDIVSISSSSSNCSYSSSIKEIVSYLNKICGTSYRDTSNKTQTLIRARIKEHFTVEDFKTVIAYKFKEWGEDAKMKAYLRPETLFGTKFESYLQNAKSNTTPTLEFGEFGTIV